MELQFYPPGFAPQFAGSSCDATHSTAFLFSSPRTGPNARGRTPGPRSKLICRGSRLPTSAVSATAHRGGLHQSADDRRRQPRAVLPYFSTVSNGGKCNWGGGATLPNTTNNFGCSSQEFGPLYRQIYWIFGGHGATHRVINNYNSRPFPKPC
jgi:hypothetical protein